MQQPETNISVYEKNDTLLTIHLVNLAPDGVTVTGDYDLTGVNLEWWQTTEVDEASARHGSLSPMAGIVVQGSTTLGVFTVQLVSSRPATFPAWNPMQSYDAGFPASFGGLYWIKKTDGGSEQPSPSATTWNQVSPFADTAVPGDYSFHIDAIKASKRTTVVVGTLHVLST